MKGLIVAIQFLTRLPTPRLTVSRDEFARSMRWFPIVGLIVGALVAAGAKLGGMVDPWIGALSGLIAWVTVTGALHLDGLGDIADGAGAAHQDKQRLLAVLADPHIGSFGVVAIALQLIAKLVLIHAVIDHDLIVALILVPFVARMGPLLWTRILPMLHDGLGARFADVVRSRDIALWALALLPCGWFLPGLLVGPVLMLLWAGWLRRTIGGLSGDGHGAGIEIMESGLMLAVLCIGAIL